MVRLQKMPAAVACLLLLCGCLLAEAPVIPIKWSDNVAATNQVPESFTEKDNVVVHVTGFNFFRYNLEADISTETLMVYQELNKLWQQVFGFDGLAQIGNRLSAAGLSDQESPFLQAIRLWREKLDGTNRDVDTFLQDRTAVTLADGDEALIQAKVTETLAAMGELEGLRAKTWQQTLADPTISENYYAHMLFQMQLETHRQVLAKLGEFIQAGRLCVNGKKISAGRQPAGTLVMVTLKVTPRHPGFENKLNKTNRGYSFNYFVKSKFALVFHAGFAYSDLADVEFDQVKTLLGDSSGNPLEGLSDQSLYQRIKDEEASKEMTAFLSYEFQSWDKMSQGLMVGIGTDLEEVGEKLYFCLSYRFKQRWVLSAGAVTGEVVQGMDEDGNETGIDLVTTIEKTEKWGGFAALSLTLF